MNSPRILVAGLGNIFLGDDAFGAETIRTLQGEPVPDGVTVKDFGIHSCDLAYAMLEGYDAVILVDATPGGRTPGTLSVSALDPPAPPEADETGEGTLRLKPAAVLRLAAAFGAPVRALYLVSCEPALLEMTSGENGLSPPVQAAIPGAVAIIRSLLSRLLSSAPIHLDHVAGAAQGAPSPPTRAKPANRREGKQDGPARSLNRLLSRGGLASFC